MTLPPEIFLGLTIFAAVGSGAIGGLLFAFSSFVMKALAQQPAEHGARTMQAINVLILNPLFMLFFMGTALVSLFLVAAAHLQRAVTLRPAWLVAGGALYLIGVFGITMFKNVPLNNRLAAHNPATPEGARFWPEYVATWLKWNHLRTAASLAASVAFVLAVR